MTDIPRIALSIRQPWAWAIIHAGKDVENRTWSTSFRGPVCIHAAKGMTRDEYDHANRHIQSVLGPVGQAWLDRWLGVTAAPSRLDRGGIIGVAEITGCVNRSGSPWFFGPWGFTIANARPVGFIPCKGALGFFGWQAEAETRERML